MSGVDLAQWLTAQLGADERIALKSVEQAMVNLNGADAASVADWHVVERPATGTFVATRDQWDRVTEIVPTYGGAHSEHIAEHDPARVLREVDGRRRTLIRCQEEMLSGIPRLVHFAQQTLREMALPYAHRPGFEEAIASAEWLGR